MFFVSLQVDMKKVFTPFATALLVLWYLLSVIGFGVHTCNSTGETYIATVASGFTCEDLHPDRHTHTTCHTCCGCHKNDDNESVGLEGLKSCCVSEYQVITLTGTRVCEDGGACGQYVCHIAVPVLMPESSWPLASSRINLFHKARSLIDPLRDYQASYGIWRI